MSGEKISVDTFAEKVKMEKYLLEEIIPVLCEGVKKKSDAYSVFFEPRDFLKKKGVHVPDNMEVEAFLTQPSALKDRSIPPLCRDHPGRIIEYSLTQYFTDQKTGCTIALTTKINFFFCIL